MAAPEVQCGIRVSPEGRGQAGHEEALGAVQRLLGDGNVKRS